MHDISRIAGCSRKYTAHCLRSTAIHALNDEGFEIRHIMYMSSHRNGASVRSYSRDCSTAQKQHLSHALAKVAKKSSSAESSSCTVVHFKDYFRTSTIGTWRAHRFTFTLTVCVKYHAAYLQSGFILGFHSKLSLNNCTYHFGSNPFNSAS